MASHGLLASALSYLPTVGGLAGLAAMGGLYYKHREQRQKERDAVSAERQRDVDAAKELTATALSLLEPVKHALSEAEERIKALQKQVTDLESAAATLTSAMEALAAASSAERAELERQISEVAGQRDAALAELGLVKAERDSLQERLAERDAELDALRQPGSTAQGV